VLKNLIKTITVNGLRRFIGVKQVKAKTKERLFFKQFHIDDEFLYTLAGSFILDFKVD
tara:strand:+ start:132 stop:305 length:174 start_codon:yes stop_codon:yes gene_type:complete